MFGGSTSLRVKRVRPAATQCRYRLRVWPLPRWREIPGRTHKSPGGEFRVSPRYLLCGVSLPGRATTGVGVDERVEGASGRLTWFVLLDVDQVEQAAPIRPLVEPHGGVASFDDLYQASYEVEAVRKVIPLAVSSVDLKGDWLVHAFSPRREGPAGTEGGSPGRTPRVGRAYHPECQRRLSVGEGSVKTRRAGSSYPVGGEFLNTP